MQWRVELDTFRDIELMVMEREASMSSISKTWTVPLNPAVIIITMLITNLCMMTEFV